MRLPLCVAAFIGLAAPTPALAEDADIRTTYRDGMVYDDDMVPGQTPNQPYYPINGMRDRSAGGSEAGMAPASTAPPNSPQLIGADGRIRTN
ncbi:MAG: hypothetical protein AcusKO_08790 [Acuticoccus sp.]